MSAIGHDGKLWQEYVWKTRTWWVSPRYFSIIQERCLENPKWMEQFLVNMGPGKVKVRVSHKVNEALRSVAPAETGTEHGT